MKCKRGQKVQLGDPQIPWPYPYIVLHTYGKRAQRVKTYEGFGAALGGPYYHSERGARGYPTDVFARRPELKQ